MYFMYYYWIRYMILQVYNMIHLCNKLARQACYADVTHARGAATGCVQLFTHGNASRIVSDA